VRIADFGAFVEILPGVQGLLHISQIDNKKIDKVSDVLKEGDTIKVKLLSIDGNKFTLSRKALLKENQNSEENNNNNNK